MVSIIFTLLVPTLKKRGEYQKDDFYSSHNNGDTADCRAIIFHPFLVHNTIIYLVPKLERKMAKKEAIDEDESMIPKWLRYLFIVIALLWLINLAFRQGAPQRTDFPLVPTRK